MSPGLLLLIIIIVLPIIATIILSFFRWKGIGFDLNFIGLYNYEKVFTDPRMLNALKNNFIWLGLFLAVPITVGFCLALALNENIRFRNLFRSIIYYPSVISFIALGIIFMFIYNPEYGLLNQILRSLHLESFAIKWLASNFVIPAITLAASWHYTGFVMVLFLGALQQLDHNLLEAAEIDGANYYQKVLHVIIPSIIPITTVIVALTMINSMRVFGLVWIMTYGGPANKSEVIGILMYKKAFESSLWGRGSAYGVIMLLLTFIPAFIYVKTMMKKED